MTVDIGSTFPLYCSSKGRAVLAAYPADVAARMLPDRLDPLTEKTVITRDGILALSLTELEVAAVIGAEGRIGGFTVLNDWSARDIQRKELRIGLGPTKAKDFATSLGPVLVTADEFDGIGILANWVGPPRRSVSRPAGGA